MPSEECLSPSLHPDPCKTLHCTGQFVSAEPSQHPRPLPELPCHPYLRRRQASLLTCQLYLLTPHPCHVQLRISSTMRPLSLLTLPCQRHRPHYHQCPVDPKVLSAGLLPGLSLQPPPSPTVRVQPHSGRPRPQFTKPCHRPFKVARVQFCHCPLEAAQAQSCHYRRRLL